VKRGAEHRLFGLAKSLPPEVLPADSPFEDTRSQSHLGIKIDGQGVEAYSRRALCCLECNAKRELFI
jgi:hypothetical protein